MSSPSFAAVPEMPKNDIGELIGQIADLQRRVQTLEHRMGDSAQSASYPETASVPAPISRTAARTSPISPLPTLGRMLLAVAGAYVLRTLTDFGAVPYGVGVGLGLIYALLWLVIAARPNLEGSFPVAVTCSTSMFILASLMWEASQHTPVISGWASAAALAGFVLVGLSLSWRRQQIVISGIVSAAVTLTAAALLLATRDLFPFTLALLVIAAATEFAACLDHQTGTRALSAIVTDAAVLVFSWLMARQGGLPEAYAPTPVRAVLAAQLLLILIYIAMAVSQTVIRRRTLTVFETAQTASALLIGMGGIVWVFKNNNAAMLELGISGLIGGLACYVASFLLFDHTNKWNFRAWTTFGLFLVLAGTFLPFSGSGFWLLWAACAIVSSWLAMGTRRPTLGLHSAVYLTLAAAVSGASSQPARMLFGEWSLSFPWLVTIGALAAAIVSWAAIAMSSPADAARWRQQISSLVIAANIAWILSGIAVYALVSATAGVWVGRIPSDTFATVALTSLSMALTWAGSRWRMRPLVWVAYGLMGIGAWKLATRDFLHEHNLTLVVSLLFYGCALIVLPRILRARAGQENIEVSTAA